MLKVRSKRDIDVQKSQVKKVQMPLNTIPESRHESLTNSSPPKLPHKQESVSVRLNSKQESSFVIKTQKM